MDSLMNLKLRKTRASRQQLVASEWDANIELLAMQLCPAEEWQHYERRMQTVARQQHSQQSSALAKGKAPAPKVRVFPVWRKYRQQAKRVATLHQAFPLFKRLPLVLSGLVGDLLFK
jgi:hypothetical protein